MTIENISAKVFKIINSHTDKQNECPCAVEKYNPHPCRHKIFND